MLVLITYDVNTETAAGRKRLRKVSKCCQSYGQRVHNSVFECIVDASGLVELKAQLLDIINIDSDSLRIYRLGKNYHSKIEQYGAKPSYDAEGFLAF